MIQCFTATASLAHAEFRGSEPQSNAILETPPENVALIFSETVGPLSISWRLPDGREVPTTAKSGGKSLFIPLPAEVDQGTYVLKWRVASSDGHPISGALVFSIGEVTAATESELTLQVAIPAVVLHAGMVIALVLLVATALFNQFVAPLTLWSTRLAYASAALVIPFGFALVGAEGLDRLGLPITLIFIEDVWLEGLKSPQLRTIGLSILASLLAFWSVRSQRRSPALLAWGLAALSFAVSGHALAGSGWVAPALTSLHAFALIFWIGGLPPLMVAVAVGDNAMRTTVLRRFSTIAFPIVILLIGSGSGLILIQSPTLQTASSPWGQLLSIKLVLVAVMLCLALWHRFGLPARAAVGMSANPKHTLALEVALGFVVLVLAMGFRLAPPPANDPITPGPTVHIHGAEAMIDVEASIAPPGLVTLTLMVATSDFDPLLPLEIQVALTDREAGIGPLRGKAEIQSDGSWVAGPFTLPTTGPWEVTTSI